MKNLKRFALFVFWLVVSLGLMSCGGDDDDDDNNNHNPSDDDAADDDAVDDDSADDDAADDDAADDDAADDDAADDDAADDDAVDDDSADDDTDDDDTAADDYVAPWPQVAIEPAGYDETGESGLLRLKSIDFDAWHRLWHQPDHGGCVHVQFTAENHTDVEIYEGFGDSTIWTGVYLGAQAMRYYVTGEAVAKQIAIEKVQTLSGHLHVTGRPGFISRFRGSQTMIDLYGGLDWCTGYDRCHLVNDGEYAGDFWIGETSRDQYTGWFHGMGMAYDLIDDEEARQLIRDDMTEVLDELLANNWWIIDEAGEPTNAGPQVLPPMQLAWIALGYHVTGLERFRSELQKHILDSYRWILEINSIALMNRYMDYFGNNLSHVNWYNALRIARAYFSEDDYNFLVSLFEGQVHTFTRLSHNPWFTAIFMGQGDYTPGKDDPYRDQVVEDLTAFREAPLEQYYLPARDPSSYTVDPVSVFLSDLLDQFPFLEELLGDISYQALEPFTVDLQCTAGFMFQWSPFLIDECGTDDPAHVNSGDEFIAAYWMASYHRAIAKIE